MSQVVMSIPHLGVTKKGETEKEVYVLGLATDLRNQTKTVDQFPIAAHNETLPQITPDIGNKGFFQYFVCSVSNVFERIKPDQPVSLSGSGILLYPNLDPNGLVALHFYIIESDSKKRNLGKLLSGIAEDKTIKDLIGTLQAAINQNIIAALMNSVISIVPKLLAKNGDDYLFSHSHSGFDFDNYGVDSPTNVQDFCIGNDRAFCTLRVRINK